MATPEQRDADSQRVAEAVNKPAADKAMAAYVETVADLLTKMMPHTADSLRQTSIHWQAVQQEGRKLYYCEDCGISYLVGAQDPDQPCGNCGAEWFSTFIEA